MKTAEEILKECTDGFEHSSRLKYEIIEAMKEYANQKLDEAADILRPYSSYGSSIVIEQKDTI